MWGDQTNKPNNPVIPQIAQAFQNDPRTKIAAGLTQAGAPGAVGGYGYGVPHGIVKMMQGIAGGIIGKGQMKKYDSDEKKYIADMQAAKMASAMAGPFGSGSLDGSATAVQGQPMGGQAGLAASSGGMTPGPQAYAPQPPNPAAQGTAGMMPGQGQSMQQPGAPGMSDQMRQAAMAAMGQQPPFGQAPATNTAQVAASRGTPDTNSFRSTSYDAAEEKAAAATGVPKQLISAIRTYGERSNANQVSSAGARGVYQFIPSTRKAFMEKYNIDPWAGPEQGAMAAALHLKESLARNDGDTGAAIGEYIGGPDRAKWGKVTNAYINRVQRGMGGAQGTEGGANPDPSAPVPAQFDPQSALKTPAPTPFAEPEKPVAEGPTQSYRRTLGSAIIDGGNRYAFQDGMKMYDEGNGEQFNADEAAATRRQGLTNAQYQSRLGRYENSQQQAEGDQYAARASERGFGNSMALQTNNQGFQAGMQDDAQAHDTAQTEQQFRNTSNLNSQQFAFSRKLAADNWMYQQALNAKKPLTGAMAKIAKSQEWLNTPAGSKFYKEASAADSDEADVLAKLDEFETLNEKQGTGGSLNVPGYGAMRRWTDTELQSMNTLSEDMSIRLAKLLPGAASDKEGARILASLPNIGSDKKSNDTTIKRMREVIARRSMKRQAELEALANGGPTAGVGFQKQWGQYVNSTDLDSGVSFDEWKANGGKAPKAGESTVSNGVKFLGFE